MKAVKLSEYCSVPNIKLEYLIHKLIPKPGRIMLVGPPKVGKSRLALQVCIAVAQGKSFLGRATKPGKSLYLEFDTPGEVWQDSVKELQEGGIDLEGEVYINDPSEWCGQKNILQKEDRQPIIDLINEVNPDLIVMDAFRKLFTGDENDSGVRLAVWDHLNNMCRGRSLMLLHHTHKLNPEYGRPAPSQAGRGSSFDGGEVEGTWFLWQGLLTGESRLDEEWAYRAVLNPDTGLFEFPEEVDMRTQVEKLTALCNEHPDLDHAHIFKQFKEKVGCSRATYYRLMHGVACCHTAAAIIAGSSSPLHSEDAGPSLDGQSTAPVASPEVSDLPHDASPAPSSETLAGTPESIEHPSG